MVVQGIVAQEAPDEGLPDAEDELDGLDGLQESDDAGEDAEDAGFLAGGRQLGWWRGGEEAAVAGSAA